MENAKQEVRDLLTEVADVLAENNWRGDLVERLREAEATQAGVRVVALNAQADAVIGFAHALADCGLVPRDSVMRVAEVTAARIRAKASISAPGMPQQQSISEHPARAAIDGAIAYGRMGTNPPPSPDHWLNEYWQIGRQLAKLGETSAWDNVTPVDAESAPEVPQPTPATPREMAIAKAVRQACINAYSPDDLARDWLDKMADIDLAEVVKSISGAAPALALFMRAAYPVSTEIDPRGYRWSEAYLDQARAAAKKSAAPEVLEDAAPTDLSKRLRDEQPAFEAWAMSYGFNCDWIEGATGRHYILEETKDAWATWQASASLATDFPPVSRIRQVLESIKDEACKFCASDELDTPLGKAITAADELSADLVDFDESIVVRGQQGTEGLRDE